MSQPAKIMEVRKHSKRIAKRNFEGYALEEEMDEIIAKKEKKDNIQEVRICKICKEEEYCMRCEFCDGWECQICTKLKSQDKFCFDFSLLTAVLHNLGHLLYKCTS